MKRVLASIIAAAFCGAAAKACAQSAAGTPVPKRPSVTANPDWAALPNNSDMWNAYPAAARSAYVEGDAKIQCSVAADGTLDGCVVLAETPQGWGFGQATLALAPRFHMRPRTVDGQAVSNGRVIIPVHWAIDHSQLRPPHEAAEEDLALARQLAHALHVDPGGQLLTYLYSADVVPTEVEITAGRAKALNASWNDAVAKLAPEFVERYARAAAQVYTHQELVDIVAFFESPAGKAYVERSKDVGNLSLRANRETLGKFVDEVEAGFCGKDACSARELRLIQTLHDRVTALPAP